MQTYAKAKSYFGSIDLLQIVAFDSSETTVFFTDLFNLKGSYFTLIW